MDRMSYGQQQRVALIRSLCQPFSFILLDEPISHLDDRNSDIMRDIVLSEAKRQGATVIVTSIGKHMNIDYDKVYNL
jgi:ABC-type phosphate/phosphonate transport system ATPase subunit